MAGEPEGLPGPSAVPWGWLARWGLALAAVFIVGTLFAGACTFAFGWIGAATEVVGPDNVREQFEQAYSRYESMEASAQKACFHQGLVDTATSDNELTQRKSQLVAVMDTYETTRAQYEAAYANAFKAALVGPRDLPKDAPSLAEMQALICK